MASPPTSPADERLQRLADLDFRLRDAMLRAPGRSELVVALISLERRVRAGRLLLEAQPLTGTAPAYLAALSFIAGDLAGACDEAAARLRAALDGLRAAKACEEERDAIYAASDTQLPDRPADSRMAPWKVEAL